MNFACLCFVSKILADKEEVFWTDNKMKVGAGPNIVWFIYKKTFEAFFRFSLVSDYGHGVSRQKASTFCMSITCQRKEAISSAQLGVKQAHCPTTIHVHCNRKLSGTLADVQSDDPSHCGNGFLPHRHKTITNAMEALDTLI